MGKWTYEDIKKEALKYKTKVDFRKYSGGAYKYAQRHHILDDFFPKYVSPNESWTEESIRAEVSKYSTKADFRKYSEAAYKYDQRHHIIDDFEWYEKEQTSKKRCIYVYVDEENKVAYVGLTVNKTERHKSHKTGLFHNKPTKSKVFDYFTSIGKEVPEPIYLEENLTPIKAQEREDYWRNKYEEDGYTMLNVGSTGIGKGSLGGFIMNLRRNNRNQEITIVLPSKESINELKKLGHLIDIEEGYVREFKEMLHQKFYPEES